MTATARSFYLIEASSFPPTHLFTAYAYVERAHVRLLLDALSEMPELVANSDLLALWVVEDGVVERVFDLKEACEIDEETETPRLLTEAIVAKLPVLKGTLLRPHERSVATWSPTLSLFDAARESPLFDENHESDFQLGAEGRGDLAGEDVTPPGLESILDEA
jgi:hypothetical protein